MKIIISDEAKSRLTNAAANGSIIAQDILAEIKKNLEVSDCIKGTANYFKTKRKKTTVDSYNSANTTYHKLKIVFTVCTKDISNPNFPDKDNPQAPWFNENRTEVDASTFVKYFKNLPEYSDNDLTYFANAICVDNKLTVKVYDKMSEIYEAYCGDNYVPFAQFGDSSLHNSCMRNDDMARNAADFYYHFAGAKLIVVKDQANYIYGRALLWEKVLYRVEEVDHIVSTVDRIYFSHTFVTNMIHEHARKLGINLRKTKNDFSSKREFTVLNPIDLLNLETDNQVNLSLYIKVPASQWHKTGAPYMDTFTFLCLTKEDDLVLINKEMDNAIAKFANTNGYAERKRKVCPNCGKAHTNAEHLCEGCETDVLVDTIFGKVMLDKAIDYDGKPYPASFFHRGKPKDKMKLFLQIQKIYDNN